MDKFHVFGYADLSNRPFLRKQLFHKQHKPNIFSFLTSSCIIRVYTDARLLYPFMCFRGSQQHRYTRCYRICILVLFLYHHHGGTYLESFGSRLPGKISLGWARNGSVPDLSNQVEPRANDLLLLFHHGSVCLMGTGRKHSYAQTVRFLQSDRCVCRRLIARRIGQYFEPLSYMGIQQREYARKIGIESRYRQPNLKRSRPRLHDPMELRHR